MNYVHRLRSTHASRQIITGWSRPFGLGLVLVTAIAVWGGLPVSARAVASGGSLCSSVLSRLVRHRVGTGETLGQVAQRYNVSVATLRGLNPAVRDRPPAAGAELLIPPFDGIQLQVPPNTTWQAIAKFFKVRADTLFEANGCVATPTTVFVPGVQWSPRFAVADSGTQAIRQGWAQLRHYPLPATAPVLVGYGWQPQANGTDSVFNSGVRLAALAGTPVRAAGTGTVAFAGEQEGYGKLVVINHEWGFQTRYAHLAEIMVKLGQRVTQGTPIATVGATGAVNQPQLGFEVRVRSPLGWVAQDPSPVLSR